MRKIVTFQPCTKCNHSRNEHRPNLNLNGKIDECFHYRNDKCCPCRSFSMG